MRAATAIRGQPYLGGDGVAGPARDREAYVAFPQARDEVPDRTGRIGTHDHTPPGGAGIIAAAVAVPDLHRQLGESTVDDVELIGGRVGTGVAGPQHRREDLAGGVTCRDHRVEPIAALEVRRRLLLVLRMDLDQRGVHIDDHVTAVIGSRPHLGTDLTLRGRQRNQRGRVDLVERPPRRRVRRDIAPQLRLFAQDRQVGEALAAVSEHHRHQRQQAAPIVKWSAFAVGHDRRRKPRR